MPTGASTEESAGEGTPGLLSTTFLCSPATPGPSFYLHGLSNPTQPQAFMSLSACAISPKRHHGCLLFVPRSRLTCQLLRKALSLSCFIIFKALILIQKLLTLLPLPPLQHELQERWPWSVLCPPHLGKDLAFTEASP